MSGNCHILNEGDTAAHMKTSKVYVVTRQMLNVFFPIVNEGNLFVLAVLGLHCSGQSFSSCGEQGLLILGTSLVIEHRL